MAVLGVDCASGDTYASQYPYCTLESMYVPEPVIKMAIEAVDREGADRMGKALRRFAHEDPTLQVSTDDETGETIIADRFDLSLNGAYAMLGKFYNNTAKDKDGKVVKHYGKYVTIWKKQADGSWKVAMDTGNSSPEPGTGKK